LLSRFHPLLHQGNLAFVLLRQGLGVGFVQFKFLDLIQDIRVLLLNLGLQLFLLLNVVLVVLFNQLKRNHGLLGVPDFGIRLVYLGLAVLNAHQSQLIQLLLEDELLLLKIRHFIRLGYLLLISDGVCLLSILQLHSQLENRFLSLLLFGTFLLISLSRLFKFTLQVTNILGMNALIRQSLG
jgi:hypothetical protein